MSIRRYQKDPSSKLPYGFDWTNWLDSESMPSGETIASAVWTIPTGLTGTGEQIGTVLTKVDISGGEAGSTYTVACKVTTTGGYITERSFEISVVQR